MVTLRVLTGCVRLLRLLSSSSTLQWQFLPQNFPISVTNTSPSTRTSLPQFRQSSSRPRVLVGSITEFTRARISTESSIPSSSTIAALFEDPFRSTLMLVLRMNWTCRWDAWFACAFVFVTALALAFAFAFAFVLFDLEFVFATLFIPVLFVLLFVVLPATGKSFTFPMDLVRANPFPFAFAFALTFAFAFAFAFKLPSLLSCICLCPCPCTCFIASKFIVSICKPMAPPRHKPN
mmetsp:Transcript_15535/g.27292  ORF Transcript_15535/g.27292 Transcript_15535/m.27292 type:complete len:235 (+) Transcript_15535:455-1159(+)